MVTNKNDVSFGGENIIKDYLTYKNKKFQLSVVKLSGIYEMMIFSIECNVVSGNEVYCFRTTAKEELNNKYRDIYFDSKKYISEEAIEKYLKEKKEWFNT